MALSRPCSPSRMVSTATTATTADGSYDEELIRMRADLVCTGCRCGWLCCDCNMGCFACKQRRRHCYCWYIRTTGTRDVTRMHCEICVELRKVCKCHLTYRCKWCLISMDKCKRGGCIVLLPCRLSPEAAPYVDLFNKEDTNEEIDAQEAGTTVYDDADKISLVSSSTTADSDTGSLLTWSSSSPTPTLEACSRSTSVYSVSSSMQDDWWQSQRVGRASSEMGESQDEAMYGSTYTLSSVSSGGTYNSVGGKSNY